MIKEGLRFIVSAFFILPFLAATVNSADFLRWKDDQGVIHYSEGILEVPPQYRNRIEVRYLSNPGAKSTVKTKSVKTKLAPYKPAKIKPRGSAKIMNLTDSNFDRETLRGNKLVVAEIWEPWCGVCRKIEPDVKAFANKYNGRVKTVKINTKQNVKTRQKYKIKGLPTFIFFKDGSVVHQQRGWYSPQSLSQLAERFL